MQNEGGGDGGGEADPNAEAQEGNSESADGGGEAGEGKASGPADPASARGIANAVHALGCYSPCLYRSASLPEDSSLCF